MAERKTYEAVDKKKYVNELRASEEIRASDKRR